jgi:hemolysin III
MAGRRFPRAEELVDFASHAVGLGASVAGLPILVLAAGASGDVGDVVGCSIFGATLILLYAASTLYHGLIRSRAKRFFGVLDHAAIYLLIAGTYTPFALTPLRGGWGWTLLAVIWSLAILGIVFEVVVRPPDRRFSLPLYLGMGWLVVVAAGPLLGSVRIPGLLLLLFGGLSYSSGVVFLLWHRLPYHHALWHVAVLAGSALHYAAILCYVIPPP